MSEYIGSRIVPKPCGVWDKTKKYEVLSVVLHPDSGDSYIARKDVPTGTAITETEYWMLCSDFSVQLKKVQDEVSALKETADTLAGQIAANVAASTDSDADYAAEVVDARVGADGNSYDSLGEAVREQFSNLFTLVDMPIEFTDGGYLGRDGAVLSFDGYSYTDYINVSGLFGYVKVRTRQFYNTPILVYDSDKNIIDVLSTANTSTTEWYEAVIENEEACYIRFTCATSVKDKAFVRIVTLKTFEEFMSAISITTEKIVDKAVTTDKMSTFIHNPSTNYIDRTKITSGYIKGNQGYTAYDTLWCTDYVELEENTTYYFSGLYVGYYAFYDSDYNVIKYKGFTETDTENESLTNPFVAPEGTKYARFTITSESSIDTAWISTQNAKPDDYAEYMGGVKIAADCIIDSSITAEKLADGSVTADKIAGYVHNPNTNYIDKTKITSGYIKGSQSYTAFSTLWCTDYVELEENTTYYFGYLYPGYYAFYDSDYNVIKYKGHQQNDTENEDLTSPFVAPAGTKYARFTITSESNTASAWIYTLNLKPDDYDLYLDSIKISGTCVIDDGIVSNPCDYDGLDVAVFNKILCIGDSLTAGTFNYYEDGGTGHYVSYGKYSYPSYFSKITGVETVNAGAGGASSAEWYAMYESEDLSGYDCAIIKLGVNDNARYGEFGDTSITAFTNIIEKLKTENSNIKIFVCTIEPAKSYSSDGCLAISEGIRSFVSDLDDEDVFLVDLGEYSHVGEKTAYNCGHLSAYGYWRVAKDIANYISYIISTESERFREVQFIGTDKVYSV